MNQYEYVVDVAYRDAYATFEESLEVLTRKCPSAMVRVLHAHSSGGGWPELYITIDRNEVDGFAEWYGGEGATTESIKAEHDVEPLSGEGHPGIWD